MGQMSLQTLDLSTANRARSLPFQFQQHGAQQGVVGRVRDERRLGDGSDEVRSLAAFGRPAKPVVEVGVGGIEYRRTSNCVLGRSSFR